MRTTLILLLITLIILGHSHLPSVQSQSSLSADELWQYGNSIIYDFEWGEQNLVLQSGNGIWQVNPISNPLPIESTTNFFPLLTSPDGTRFVSQGQSGMLIRNTSTGTTITTIPRNYIDRTSATWQPNTNLLTTPGYSEEALAERRYYMELWDTDSGEIVATVGGYPDSIKAYSWHPNGELLAVSLLNNTIIIENVVRGEPVHVLTVSAAVDALTWSPDGTKLAATSNSQSPGAVWQTDTFELLPTTNPPMFILTVAWNADSVHLAGALPGGGVGIWNVETEEYASLGIEVDHGVDRAVEHVAWHGDWLAALDRTQHVRIWDVDRNMQLWDSTEYAFHNTMRSMAVAQDGSRIAVGYDSTFEILVLDGATGELRQTLTSPELLYRIDAMAWSPSGEQLALTAGNLFVWSLRQDPNTPLITTEIVDGLSWSPDGTLAVKSGGQDVLRLIDSSTGELLPAPDVSHVRVPVWNPDGRYLALYRYNPPSDDDTIPAFQIDVWDRNLDVTTTLSFPNSEISRSIPSDTFAWLPTSSGLIGFTQNGALWRWQLDTQLVEIMVPSPSADAVNQLFRLGINPSGNLLAVSSTMTNGQVQILDAKSGQVLLTLDNFGVGTRFFAWGAEDMLVIYDGVLRAYRIS